MNASKLRSAIPAILLVLGVGIVGGCNSYDQPDMVEAPAFEPPPEAKAEPVGKPAGYGEHSKYQEMMDQRFGSQ
jgi:hypothetical protein